MKRSLYALLFLLTGAFFVWKKFDQKTTLVINSKCFWLQNELIENRIPKVFKGILSKKYNLEYSEKNYNILFDFPFCDKRDYNAIEEVSDNVVKIFYTPEAILPKLDNFDLVIGFDRIENNKFFRFPYYDLVGSNKKNNVDYDRGKDLGVCNPHKEYFACFLVSNNSTMNTRNNLPMDGCIARSSIFNKLSKYKRVESGGKYANNIGKIISGEETTKWLSNCKFVIAYENQSYNGYITEKPFQAYFAGAIPIYYGDKTAVTDINKKAVIYAGDFNSEEDLIEYIKKVDNDDKLYCDIWNEKIIIDPEMNYNVVKAKLQEKLFKIIDEKLGDK